MYTESLWKTCILTALPDDVVWCFFLMFSGLPLQSAENKVMLCLYTFHAGDNVENHNLAILCISYG